MTTSFVRIGVTASTALALLIPVSTFAYLSPDQVFGSSSVQQTEGTTAEQSPFPTKRDAEIYAEAQQNAINQRRADIQRKELKPVDAEPEDTYMAPARQKPASRLDPEVNYQLRMQRLANEKSGSPSIIIAGQGTVVDRHGNVLHSGAPSISGTGPESRIVFVVLAFSAIATCVMASVRRHRLHV